MLILSFIFFLQSGSIVMLYHPCAPEQLVDQLRKIVVGCLRLKNNFSPKHPQVKQLFSKNLRLKQHLKKCPQKAHYCPKCEVHHLEKATDTRCLALQVRQLKIVYLMYFSVRKIFSLKKCLPRLTMATVNQKEVRSIWLWNLFSKN